MPPYITTDEEFQLLVDTGLEIVQVLAKE